MRRNAGHTQEQFAALLGVSARWVRRLEQQGENLTLHTLFKLAAALDVDPKALLDEPSPEARKLRPGRPPKRSS